MLVYLVDGRGTYTAPKLRCVELPLQVVLPRMHSTEWNLDRGTHSQYSASILVPHRRNPCWDECR